MNINEIFLSIQGEGLYTGEKMVFIRTEYCNLRCSWCDTKYSFYEGREMSIGEITDAVERLNSEHRANWICLTGGEPLLQRDVSHLVNSLSKSYNILLETSGSIDIKRFLPDYANVRKDVDFKLPSSGMYRKFNDRNISYMEKGDYIKFVVNDIKDFLVAYRSCIVNGFENATFAFFPFNNFRAFPGVVGIKGSIADDKNRFHIHIGVARKDHKLYGGHFFSGTADPLMEIKITKFDQAEFTRKYNPVSTLNELEIH